MTQRLSHREKRGLLIATLVLILIAGGRMLYTALTPKAGGTPTNSANISEINFPKKPTRQSHPAKVPTQLFDFDPNTADSATFIRIGLPHWMAHNALKYRRKGGRWRKAEDFKRLYGMTNERFALLEPYIKIVPPPPTQHKATEPPHRASHSRKFDAVVVFNLNVVDTTTLQRIPGIGTYYSKAIVNYRERLGGYVRVEQLHEIEGLPTDLAQWFSTDSTQRPQTIAINQATFKALLRHPYLNYEQVKTIVTHRERFGPLVSWKELLMYEAFTQADTLRLHPYFTLSTPDERQQQRPAMP